jgi:hypothetical protein
LRKAKRRKRRSKSSEEDREDENIHMEIWQTAGWMKERGNCILATITIILLGRAIHHYSPTILITITIQYYPSFPPLPVFLFVFCSLWHVAQEK